MAARTWNSTSSQTFITSSNYAEATSPSAGDDVFINQGVSIDGADHNTINLGSLAVGRDYAGSIGSSGAYLIISANSVSLQCGPECGDIYLDGGATDELDDIRIDSAAANQTIYLKGDIGTLVINHGRVIQVSGTADNVHIEWDGTGTRPTYENVAATVTAFHGNRPSDSSMTGAGTITTLNLSSGEFEASNGTVTTVNVRGGTYIHKTAATITTAEVFDTGIFDGSQDARSKTITNARLHQGGTMNLDNGRPSSFTLTNQAEYGGDRIKVTQPA